jgi:dihydrofolate synthase/folylpolyglutamate synthase
MTTYAECLQTMFSLRRFGIKLGLDTIRGMLAGLGDPQNAFQSVHVAGTNGKGSVASTLASILQQAGFRVGLYTSPHLVRFNERIRIDGRPVADAEVVAAYEALRQVHRAAREPTFFEFSTAMAMDVFRRHKVDWAVIETGMGGRLDATNVLNPALSVITNIALEHREYLGHSLAAIAREKAGIIKPCIPVVTGIGQTVAQQVAEARAAELAAPCFRRGRDFRCRRNHDGHFSYYGLDHRWPELRTRLLGEHQVENAALALAGVELLMRRGVAIAEKHVRDGLAHTIWPGRLETVSETPHVILDGAHNLAAARNLARYLTRHLADRRILLVAGILDDKPAKGMLAALLPVCRRAVISAPRIGRAIPAERLAAIARGFMPNVETAPTVDQAVKKALTSARPEDTIVVAGSLYVVGEAVETLEALGIMTPPG